MENTVSKINSFPKTLAERKQFVADLVNEFENGNGSPLETYKVIKEIEALLKDISKNDDIRDMVVKGITGNEGCGLEIRHRKTYDFATSNDTTIVELKAQEIDIKTKIKDREKYLISIPEEGAIHPETGELLMRPSYSETEIIAKSR